MERCSMQAVVDDEATVMEALAMVVAAVVA